MASNTYYAGGEQSPSGKFRLTTACMGRRKLIAAGNDFARTIATGEEVMLLDVPHGSIGAARCEMKIRDCQGERSLY